MTDKNAKVTDKITKVVDKLVELTDKITKVVDKQDNRTRSARLRVSSPRFSS
ncbi:hypothetical protein NBRC111894_1225 [Sporolactobacillus inulinus]|uniref:Uncharacterized protein n=1 Tax=Sporolactobacillus inulinus TaxID=2078 RepID=A0A4Y1Z9T5_9BACL|nr:hypothetical protein NBRC111894_1225 [Sporolactobacillus inulinus]